MDRIENVVFIWIPKNAGTSLHRMLGKPPELRRPDLIQKDWNHQNMVTFGHVDYTELTDMSIVKKRWDDRAFKFAFCRDPYDRVISLYLYLKRIGLHDEDSFLSFCRLLTEGIPPIGYYNWKGLSQCNPQVRWVENIDLNFLGRVEDFEEDSKMLFDILRPSFPNLPPWKPIRLNDSDYSNEHVYHNEETRQIVEHFYVEDFKYFNYKMGVAV